MKPEIQKQKREQYGDKVDPIGLTQKVSGSFEMMGLHPLLIRGENGENLDLLFLTADGKSGSINLKKISALIKREEVFTGPGLVCVVDGSGEGRSPSSICLRIDIKRRG